MFPFQQLDVNSIPENDRSLKRFGRVEGGNIATQSQFSVLEDFGKLRENNLFSSDLRFYEETGVEERKIQLISDFQGLNYVYHDVVAQPTQLSADGIAKFASSRSENSEVLEPEKRSTFSSLRILKDFTGRGRSRHMNGRKLNVPSYDRACIKVSGRKSTIAIISLAGEKFIQCFSQRVDDVSLLSNPFAFSFMGLADEESRDVELVHDLLFCAEKVGHQQFDSASKLITQCDKLSSNKGNPVQRLTFYFSAALREKLNQETGGLKYDGSGKKQLLGLRESTMCPNPSIIALHQKVPFAQVCQFTSIQTIAENIRGARKFHIIDMEIRNGVQYTILIQLLAARGENFLQHLKITAIGTCSKSKIEETGKRLMSVAQSMNVPLTFKVVMVADMLDLNIDLLELDDMEDCAIYSAYFLTSLIRQPEHMDHLIRVFRNVNPCVIIVNEFEANHNSPAFVTRFIESLFYYGAFFDALANCMADVESNRRDIEADLGLMIKNTVAAEGEERIVRHVTLDVWRTYFTRFGLVEADLSSVSEYQADLLVKSFECGSLCSVDMDGKCFIVGWKGAPIFSVSAWRFL